MSFGSAQTNKTLIGTVELRIGMLNEANKLTAMHSVGIVDSVKLESTTDTAELMSGSPQRQVDVAITKSSTTFTATMRETSRRNMNILLSNPDIAPDSSGSHIVGSVFTKNAINANSKSLEVLATSLGQVREGDVIGVFPTANPSEFQLCEVASVGVATSSAAYSTTLSGYTGESISFSNGEEVPLTVAANNSYTLLVKGTDAEKLTFSYRDNVAVTAAAAAISPLTFTVTNAAFIPTIASPVQFSAAVGSLIEKNKVYYVKSITGTTFTVAADAISATSAITSTAEIVSVSLEMVATNLLSGTLSQPDVEDATAIITFDAGVDHNFVAGGEFSLDSKAAAVEGVARNVKYYVTHVDGQKVSFVSKDKSGVEQKVTATVGGQVKITRNFKVASRSIIGGKDGELSTFAYTIPTLTATDVARGISLQYSGAAGGAVSVATAVGVSRAQTLVLVDNLLTGFESGEDVSFYVTRRVSGGATSDRPTYYTVQLLRTDRSTGLPVGINIWKAFVTSGLSLSSNATDFASYDLVMKALEPLRTEYLVEGAVLNHVSKRVQESPIFEIFDVADTATG